MTIEQMAAVTLGARGCFGGRSARGMRGSPAEGYPIRFVQGLAKYQVSLIVTSWSDGASKGLDAMADGSRGARGEPHVGAQQI